MAFKKTVTTVPTTVQYSDPLTAVVTPVNISDPAPTGSVEFFVNGISVGSAPVDGNGLASLVVTPSSHQEVLA